MYEQRVDASQPPEGVMLVQNMNGEILNRFKYTAPGIGMLLAGLAACQTLRFITTTEDTRTPHPGFITRGN